eukprot:gb/GECG01008105.1/.p1 GENE.gb/GECG01008105.1/~~gb/GECG01008105.1/.p1  ORF type:complete len:138 (+),score=6.42 gb/GECG01008105.1/:1-414(+)
MPAMWTWEDTTDGTKKHVLPVRRTNTLEPKTASAPIATQERYLLKTSPVARNATTTPLHPSKIPIASGARVMRYPTDMASVVFFVGQGKHPTQRGMHVSRAALVNLRQASTPNASTAETEPFLLRRRMIVLPLRYTV